MSASPTADRAHAGRGRRRPSRPGSAGGDPRARPGHDERACVVVDRAGRIARSSTGDRSTYPEPGWVEQDAVQLWKTQRAAARQALEAGPERRRRGGRASPTSARPPSSGSAPAACRSRRPSSGRIVARPTSVARCARPVTSGSCVSAPASCSTRTSRPPSCADAGHIARRLGRVAAASSPSARSTPGSSKLDRRPAARDRCDQRLAHAALRHPHRRLGRRAAGALRGAARVLPEVVDTSGVIGETEPAAVRRAAVHRRPVRRPAGGAVRPGLRRARPAKVTYGTGCFLLAHRARSRSSRPRTACDRGPAARRSAHVRPRGQRLRRRRGHRLAV